MQQACIVLHVHVVFLTLHVIEMYSEKVASEEEERTGERWRGTIALGHVCYCGNIILFTVSGRLCLIVKLLLSKAGQILHWPPIGCLSFHYDNCHLHLGRNCSERHMDFLQRRPVPLSCVAVEDSTSGRGRHSHPDFPG